MHWVYYQVIQSLSKTTEEYKIHELSMYPHLLQGLTQHHYSLNLHLWSFIVTSRTSIRRNFPSFLKFFKYHVYVTCCVFIYFCSCVCHLLLVSAVSIPQTWGFTSFQCLYLTSLWSLLFWSMADKCVLKFCSHSGSAFYLDPSLRSS